MLADVRQKVAILLNFRLAVCILVRKNKDRSFWPCPMTRLRFDSPKRSLSRFGLGMLPEARHAICLMCSGSTSQSHPIEGNSTTQGGEVFILSGHLSHRGRKKITGACRVLLYRKEKAPNNGYFVTMDNLHTWSRTHKNGFKTEHLAASLKKMPPAGGTKLQIPRVIERRIKRSFANTFHENPRPHSRGVFLMLYKVQRSPTHARKGEFRRSPGSRSKAVVFIL